MKKNLDSGNHGAKRMENHNDTMIDLSAMVRQLKFYTLDFVRDYKQVAKKLSKVEKQGSSKANRKTVISSCLKYFLFFINFAFWVGGAFFAGVGLYAFLDKKKQIMDIMDVVLDPTILMLACGCVMFVLAFLGCTGSLREKTCLLKTFSYTIIFIFVATVVLGGVAFVLIFADPNTTNVNPASFLTQAVYKYRDDPDLQDLIDGLQVGFKCCGVGPDGYRDWNMNTYYNCTEQNPSIERCAVPRSCCLYEDDKPPNSICGFDALKKTEPEARDVINTVGCYPTIMAWIEDHGTILASCVTAVLIPMLLVIFLSLRLLAQIEEQKARWKYGRR